MIYGYCRAVPWSANPQEILRMQAHQLREAYPEGVIVEEVAGSDNESEQLTLLLDRVAPGDRVAFASMEAFAFSMKEVMGILEPLWETGVEVHILNLGLMDDSVQGRVLRQALNAFSDFERTHVNERINRGKYVASQQPGYRDGRPLKYSREKLSEALDLLKDHSYKQVEQLTGISKSTLIREKRKLNL